MIAPRRRYLAKGATRMPVQFIAAKDVEEQTALIQLLARPVDKSVKLESATRQAIALYNHPVEFPLHYVFLDKFALAITKPAPFEVTMEQPAIPITRTGEMMLKVKVERHGDFNGPVELMPDWLPPGVSGGGATLIAADKSEGEVKIQANAKAGTPARLSDRDQRHHHPGRCFQRLRTGSRFDDIHQARGLRTVSHHRPAPIFGGARQDRRDCRWRGQGEQARCLQPPYGYADASSQGRNAGGECSRDQVGRQGKSVFGKCRLRTTRCSGCTKRLHVK